jgi:hypothetical protein
MCEPPKPSADTLIPVRPNTRYGILPWRESTDGFKWLVVALAEPLAG